MSRQMGKSVFLEAGKLMRVIIPAWLLAMALLAAACGGPSLSASGEPSPQPTVTPATASLTSDDIDADPVMKENIPEGELDIDSGTDIHATDGHIGPLDEFVVDLDSGKITHLITHEGHLWRKHSLAVSVSAIDYIAGGTVYLKLDKNAVDAFPPM
ncbi:MAG: hypothetical protein U9R25_15875 [Chloroflexota bacterium]|nr:hypothetical protein [Chloroflexota bacterium]